MASSSSSSVPNPFMTEKQNFQTGHSHHPQQPLQCPRCNSSNTKFCYYNNYSLSQPRHFCKACKRYWTRGGTLRNVPVGGGRRRNKRLKRPPPDETPPAAQSPHPNPKMNNSPSSLNRLINKPSLFYGGIQPTNNLLESLNFPFSSLISSRYSDENMGFDFQPQINGLGFSSGHVNRPPLNWSPSPYSSTAANNSVVFGSSANFGSSSTMASLLASTFQKQKFEFKGNFKDPTNESGYGASDMMPYGGTPLLSHLGNAVTGNNDVKVEVENGLGFGPTPMDHLNSSDPSPLLWETNNLGGWSDLSNSNMGSSVSSLI